MYRFLLFFCIICRNDHSNYVFTITPPPPPCVIHREANQISDATALISVILLTKKIRFEENDGDEEIAYGDHKRIIHTGGIAEDHSILDIDESSVILMLQVSYHDFHNPSCTLNLT